MDGKLGGRGGADSECGIRLGLVVPHPPLLIPEIGHGHLKQVEATVRGMEEAAAAVREAGVESLIVISPHGPVFRDAVAVSLEPELSGDFRGFGARTSFSFANDVPLAQAIMQELEAAGVNPVGLDRLESERYGLDTSLDHGTLVPLHFLERAGVKAAVVPVGMSLMEPDRLLAVGEAFRRAADALGRSVAIVASGDLSHRLTHDAPAGFDPAGKEFDRRLVTLLERGDVDGLAALDEGLRDAAGECGYRSFLMMLGAFSRTRVLSRVLSYEGPFGVGYCVALVHPASAAAAEPASLGKDPLTALARAAVEAYVERGEVLAAPEPLPRELAGRAAVFVTLHKFGELRGCIGTTAPTEPDLARQIIRYAIYAATEDPRFAPVEEEELADLEVSVDVLTPPEAIAGPEELDPRIYGVVVRRGGRSGLLLPDLEGIDTVEEQLEIARRKAGIGPDEPVELARFQVVRHH